jgi:tRNA nucleotidyltransferase (CCA-adding enzyme)
MQIKIPENVEKIINTLEAAGFEAYAVGGCVRDTLLNRTPNDWDITTSAHPEDVKKLFKVTFDTGIEHGTVSVLLDKVVYEVTTYRIDGEYDDARHPNSVLFTDSLKEDLRRRDFTINAMAYNPRTGIVDLYGGREDIENRIVRCVGDAKERFDEDALRILRAVRFAAQLGYTIEKETKKAITELAENLKKISAERIREEFLKMITSDNPGYIVEAYELGITKVFLPEFDLMMRTPQNNPHHAYTVGVHTVKVMENIKADKVLRLAALLHDVGKPATRKTGDNGIDHFYGHPKVGVDISKDIFNRLKFDNETKRKVCTLVGCHDWIIESSDIHIRKEIHRIGEEAFPDIFELNRADILGQGKYRMEEKLELLDRVRKAYDEVMERKECVSLKTLAVTGADLIKAGCKEGPEIGKKLESLLEKVLEDPSLNTKEKLLELL